MVNYIINHFYCLSIVLYANQKSPQVRMFTGAEGMQAEAKVINILNILLSEMKSMLC